MIKFACKIDFDEEEGGLMLEVREKNQRLELKDEQGGKHIYVDRRRAKDFPVHWHNFFEIELVISGNGVHILNGVAYNVSRGSVYILNPADFHRLEPGEELVVWNISFDESMISDGRLCELTGALAKKAFDFPDSEFECILKIAELLSEEAKREDCGCSRELCECLLTLILRGDGRSAPQENDRFSKIKRAILYLEVYFRENPTLEEVAAYVNLNPHYFSELFRKVTGENFSTRLGGLKINYAKSLLAKGFSVADTCYNSGFGSISNFLSVFKRKVGMSAGAYRKMIGKSGEVDAKR